MAVFCRACGANKSLHTPDLWREHQKMYDAYIKITKEYERYIKTTRKKMKLG